MHDHFRIGFRGENRALRAQLGAQVIGIFDNPVVDQCKTSIGTDMWVRIRNGWTTVGCPTSVSDPSESISGRILINGLAQVNQLSDGLDDIQLPRACQGNSRGVVSAIFQT